MRHLTLSFVLLLGACGGGQSPTPAASPAPTIVAAEEAFVTPTKDVTAAPVKQNITANFLLGRSPAEVMKMVGAPSLVRRDNLVQHMLFESKACVLDVIYYADDAGAPYLANYVSARGEDGSAYDAKACLEMQLPDGWLWDPDLDEEDNAPHTAANLKPIEISEQ